METHYHINDFIFFVRQRSSDIPILKEVILFDNYKIVGKLKAHDIVIDIGGHIGSFSIFASSMGTSVLTYEPVKRNFDLLEKNVEINGFPVNIHKMAVMGHLDTQKVYVKDFNFGGSNMYNVNNDPDFSEDVFCTTLDKIFEDNHLSSCDFLKLDCEGSELEILENSGHLSDIKTIAMEYHGMKMRDSIMKLLSRTHEQTDDRHSDAMGTMIFERK